MTGLMGATPLRSPRLSHHVIQLDDGHHVGVTLGGQGIPLVFLHGIGLNGSVYTRFLSRLSTHGFRVIAIDAVAHGRTAPLRAGDFRSGVALLVRTLDRLGIRQAVMVGHSMGGRATIELAAGQPDRVLAAVLLDAAAGDAFDASAKRALESLPALATGLCGALYDTAVDWWRCSNWRDRRLYGLSLAAALARWGGRPHLLAAAINSVANSAPTGELLRRVRGHGVPVIVVHAENDLVVPWGNAVTMAEHAGGSLHKVPHAYHSWMIADPQRGADTLGRLMNTELDQLLRREPRAPAHGNATTASAGFLAPGALAAVLGLVADPGQAESASATRLPKPGAKRSPSEVSGSASHPSR